MPTPRLAHPKPTPLPTAILLALGLLLFAANFDPQRTTRYLITAALTAITLYPPIRTPLTRLLDHLRNPTPRQRRLTFTAILTTSALYFITSASLAHRVLFPKFIDEFMFLLQARMLAAGHLWMPPHPLAPFFDSFNVITRPVYAAIYFPGTALLYVPGIWLHLPPWVTSIVITSLAVAMLYLLMTTLFDGVAGLLAALMAVALYQLRSFSVVTESHPAMLLLLLLAAWSCARWRQTRHLPWLIAFGAAAGWAAITRPLDALCLVLPLCLFTLWDSFRPSPTRPRPAFILLTLLAAATPFLLLQLIFDKGVTGHYLQTPFSQYAHSNFPALDFGYHPHPSPPPSSSPLPQVQDFYNSFCINDLPDYAREPFLKTWLSYRLAPAANIALPAHAFYILLPLGIIASLRHRRPLACLLTAGAFLFPFLYTFYPSYLLHYGLVCIPAFLTPCLAAESSLHELLPRKYSCLLPAAIALFSLASLPELRGTTDPFFPATSLADINAKLSLLDHTPAIVLFHYDPIGHFEQEPVYNLDTPNPDDSPIIRAQDLGPTQNPLLFSYYAHLHPPRFIYLYNRTTNTLTPLGFAPDLANK